MIFVFKNSCEIRPLGLSHMPVPLLGLELVDVRPSKGSFGILGYSFIASSVRAINLEWSPILGRTQSVAVEYEEGITML